MEVHNPYFLYYLDRQKSPAEFHQEGKGVLPYYHSRFVVQGGRGWFTNLLSSGWNWLKPIFSSATRELGSEVLKTGSRIVGDVMKDPLDSLGDILKRRGKEGLSNLAQRSADVLRGQGKRTKTTKRLNARKRRPALPDAPRPNRRRQQQQSAQLSPHIAHIRDIFSPPTPP